MARDASPAEGHEGSVPLYDREVLKIDGNSSSLGLLLQRYDPIDPIIIKPLCTTCCYRHTYLTPLWVTA